MFEPIGGEQVYEGSIFDVRRERFRHDDGGEVTREWVVHPGEVSVLAHDGQCFFMITQPREAVGEEALLEIPAGKLDEKGEEPLEAARRELAEEIGKRADSWRHLTTYYSSAGFTDEENHIYLATDLSDHSAESEEEERIEIRRVPLADLDETIERCKDAKTLIGLLWFRAYLRTD